MSRYQLSSVGERSPAAARPALPARCGAAVAGSRSARRAPTMSARSEDTRLNSSHDQISYAVFCLKKKKKLFAPQHTGLLLGSAENSSHPAVHARSPLPSLGLCGPTPTLSRAFSWTTDCDDVASVTR